MIKKPQVNQSMMALLIILSALFACTQETGQTAIQTQTEPVAKLMMTDHPHPHPHPEDTRAPEFTTIKHPHPESAQYALKCAIGIVEDQDDISYRSVYPTDADYQDVVLGLLDVLNDDLQDTVGRQQIEEIQFHIHNFEECLHSHPEGPRFDQDCAISTVYDEVASYREVFYPVSEVYRDVAQEMLAYLNNGLRDTVNRQQIEKIQSTIDHLEECLNF